MAAGQTREIDRELSAIQESLDGDYGLEKRANGVWHLQYDEGLEVPVVTANGNFSHRMQFLAQKAGFYEHDLGYAETFKVKNSLENAGFICEDQLTVEIPHELSDIISEDHNIGGLYKSKYGVDKEMKIQVAKSVQESDRTHAKSRMLTDNIDLTPNEIGKTLSVLEEEYQLNSNEFRSNKADISWKIELLEEEGFIEDYLEE